MLIDFSVFNYRSIGDKQTLSLVPAPKQKDYMDNIFSHGAFSSLNAAALYGANASGKTNFLRALNLMELMVFNSSKIPSTANLPYDPFLLREGYDSQPTEFEVTFIYNDIRYRYGFRYDSKVIRNEWLYRKNIGREVALFLREGDTIDARVSFCNKKTIVDAVIEATRDNALFLSQSDVFNIEEAKHVMAWFSSFVIINGLKTDRLETQTVGLWKNPANRNEINKFLKEVAIDIESVDIRTIDDRGSQVAEKDHGPGGNGMTAYNIQSLHRRYDREGRATDAMLSWDFEKYESAGSLKILQMSCPVLLTLARGSILIIDEIEAKLHPVLTLNIIDMFLDARVNKKMAQLIFATHDTNLLSYARLRRDQIYFCEKNRWQSTEIFSLADFVYFNERDGKVVEEKERKDSDKERRYMEGRYGAIPVLGKFKENMMKVLWQGKEA